MPRWLWWAPLILLTAVAGLLVFRMGYVTAHLTETDIITHFAERYVAEGPEGAKMTDCVARPGTSEKVWLVVHCGGPAHGVQYRVDRFGRLLRDVAPLGPET